jgi:hypothetical protein
MSRDGLLLAAIPDDADTQRSWSRFVSVGLSLRGVVEFKDASWILCSDDSVMVFVITGPQVRAGIVMSRLEQEMQTMNHSPIMTATATPAPSLTPASTPEQETVLAPASPDAAGDGDVDVDDVDDVDDFGMLQSEFAGLHDPVEEPASPEPGENGTDRRDTATES